MRIETDLAIFDIDDFVFDTVVKDMTEKEAEHFKVALAESSERMLRNFATINTCGDLALAAALQNSRLHRLQFITLK